MCIFKIENFILHGWALMSFVQRIIYSALGLVSVHVCVCVCFAVFSVIVSDKAKGNKFFKKKNVKKLLLHICKYGKALVKRIVLC